MFFVSWGVRVQGSGFVVQSFGYGSLHHPSYTLGAVSSQEQSVMGLVLRAAHIRMWAFLTGTDWDQYPTYASCFGFLLRYAYLWVIKALTARVKIPRENVIWAQVATISSKGFRACKGWGCTWQSTCQLQQFLQ